jgi:hypothetical protein
MNLLAFHAVCDCREPLWKNARERSGKGTELIPQSALQDRNPALPELARSL